LEDKSLKLLVVLLKASQIINNKVKKDMLNYGVNPTEFAVMELLYSKGRQPIQQIGNKILLASSSTTYVIDKLVEKGFVTRNSCLEDKRITFADLSNKGIEFMEESFPKHRIAINELFDHLSEVEKEQSIELIKKIGLGR